MTRCSSSSSKAEEEKEAKVAEERWRRFLFRMDRLLIRVINRVNTNSQIIRQMQANAREDLRTKGYVQALVADIENDYETYPPAPVSPPREGGTSDSSPSHRRNASPSLPASPLPPLQIRRGRTLGQKLAVPFWQQAEAKAAARGQGWRRRRQRGRGGGTGGAEQLTAASGWRRQLSAVGTKQRACQAAILAIVIGGLVAVFTVITVFLIALCNRSGGCARR
uniref:Uncharacterized protein n=1 Tax=Oryza punctata TaxID=4537 RepID=A0A0E0MJ17_ORYPU